jgi:hypothetical protein
MNSLRIDLVEHYSRAAFVDLLLALKKCPNGVSSRDAPLDHHDEHVDLLCKCICINNWPQGWQVNDDVVVFCPQSLQKSLHGL